MEKITLDDIYKILGSTLYSIGLTDDDSIGLIKDCATKVIIEDDCINVMTLNSFYDIDDFNLTWFIDKDKALEKLKDIVSKLS